MTNEHDTIPTGPETPEDQAWEVVEAMGADAPAQAVSAILNAGRRHAELVERLGGPERFE